MTLTYKRIRMWSSEFRLSTTVDGIAYNIYLMQPNRFHIYPKGDANTYANFAIVRGQVVSEGGHASKNERDVFDHIAQDFTKNMSRAAFAEDKRIRGLQHIRRKKEIIEERREKIERALIDVNKAIERWENEPVFPIDFE